MSYGYPDHGHDDLSRTVEDVRYDADRRISDLQDELYRMRHELYDYIHSSLDDVHAQINAATKREPAS